MMKNVGIMYFMQFYFKFYIKATH